MVRVPSKITDAVTQIGVVTLFISIGLGCTGYTELGLCFIAPSVVSALWMIGLNSGAIKEIQTHGRISSGDPDDSGQRSNEALRRLGDLPPGEGLPDSRLRADAPGQEAVQPGPLPRQECGSEQRLLQCLDRAAEGFAPRDGRLLDEPTIREWLLAIVRRGPADVSLGDPQICLERDHLHAHFQPDECTWKFVKDGPVKISLYNARIPSPFPHQDYAQLVALERCLFESTS